MTVVFSVKSDTNELTHARAIAAVPMVGQAARLYARAR
jgi:hypothetical protein